MIKVAINLPYNTIVTLAEGATDPLLRGVAQRVVDLTDKLGEFCEAVIWMSGAPVFAAGEEGLNCWIQIRDTLLLPTLHILPKSIGTPEEDS